MRNRVNGNEPIAADDLGRTMPAIALVSSCPPTSTIRIRAALGYHRTRDLRLVVPWLGIHIRWTRGIVCDLEVGAGQAIDFTARVSPELARRIVAAGKAGSVPFDFIQLEPEEAEHLARAIARAIPNGTERRIPVIDAYSPQNGVLVPVELVRNQLVDDFDPTS